MTALTADRLVDACGDASAAAGISIQTILEPLGGPGTPVKPAIYPGGSYQIDRRWWGEGESREVVDAVVIDNVPSQANRCEIALERLQPELGLPVIQLDLSAVPIPPHLPRRLSSFRFPHRNADAYLRDGMLDGTRFPTTSIGSEIFLGTADYPEPLLQWFPHALLYGFWQSHLGKKRSQAKVARSWVSEIVGYRPATIETSALGLKSDPLNLSVDDRAIFDEDDLLDNPWELVVGETKSRGGRGERLSELGHGQVPVGEDASRAPVSFSELSQRSIVSFASLRRIHPERKEAGPAARALLVALGLVGHTAAFGGPFHLRSGADLRPVDTTWMWLGSDGDEELEPLDLSQARELFSACVAKAEEAGLPVGSQWDVLELEPNDSLRKAITRTWSLE